MEQKIKELVDFANKNNLCIVSTNETLDTFVKYISANFTPNEEVEKKIKEAKLAIVDKLVNRAIEELTNE